MERTLLTLYCALCLVHLAFCLPFRWGRRKFCQDLTKALLMPALLAAVLAGGEAGLLVPAALLFGWAGDVLLLWPDRKPCFLAGLVSFLVGHGCYIPALLAGVKISAPRGILAAALLALLGAAAYASLRRHLPGEMKLPVAAYLLTILGMAWAAVMRGEALLIAGAAFFVLSDYILARSLFVKRHGWTDAAVMLPYLAAQLCLAGGLAGLLAI